MTEQEDPIVLEYVDVETPRTATGQVVVRSESISVNHSDVMVREGLHPVDAAFASRGRSHQ